MKVIIAEKPSVAREIATIVGANRRKEGYIEGDGVAVTWAFGHLVALAMPDKYGITGYKADNLPILPASFILEPRQVKEGKEYKPDPGAVKQLSIIKELFDRADRIVVATDAGREGELIFRFIYNYLECGKPFDRLWISSLTDRAIQEGLQNIKLGSDYDNLYLCAKARSEADWIVGINASQALAIAAGRGVWSLGRVQTPTLAIICARFMENKAFTAQTYYQLKLHTAKDATRFSALSVVKYAHREDADNAYAAVTDAVSAQVVSVERKQVQEQPPLLYDLTTLQKEANTRHGFSADKTLTLAQTLYERKLITYPRTGSRYIPADVAQEIPTLIANLKRSILFAEYIRTMDTSSLNSRAVDDEKITDHHALLPTGDTSTELSADECTIYTMVAGRMLEAFSPLCQKENTTVLIQCAGTEFSARGTTIITPGWRGVFVTPQEQDDDSDTTILPNIAQGNTLPVAGCDVQQKQTKPRPIHTESSLLAAMETAGGELEDDAQREAMKESGIGTPATRAAIIETLLARDYIRREKKKLIPTEKGLSVYQAVHDKRIADVALTGSWELALSKIAAGEMDAFTFHKGIEVFAAQITKELLAASVPTGEPAAGAMCPRCGGKVVFYPKVAKCRNPDCTLVVFRAIAQKELTDSQLADLLNKGKTTTIKGFKAKSGSDFDAAITFDEQFKTTFVFAPQRTTKPKKRK